MAEVIAHALPHAGPQVSDDAGEVSAALSGLQVKTVESQDDVALVSFQPSAGGPRWQAVAARRPDGRFQIVRLSDETIDTLDRNHTLSAPCSRP